ncbi:MAG: hypothetical protein P4L51_14500 [Puia sp.]|nr:hypothetical protein [Puia sp.]
MFSPGQLAREHLRRADDIDKYVIIRHTHPGHMIYEQDHELSRKGEFSSLEVGLASLEKIISDVFANKQNTRQFEVIELMGQFRDKSLQLSYDGIPQNNTGFVISHFYNEHGAKEPVIKSEHRPDQMNTLYERLRLQLEFGDKGQIRLHVRDGLFKEVDLERGFGIKNP